MLLSTKFFVPRPGEPTVRRVRLYEKLSAGLKTRLILLSATAGFGKTTAIASWLHHLRVQEGDNMPAVAWLALDESDNDPTRFFAYLIGAFQRIDARLGVSLQHLLQTPQPLVWEGLLTTLINELSQQKNELLLVLDDYHFIVAQEIQRAMTFFIENLPPNVHLAVTTRSDPPWPLARWRVKRHIVDIRAADLRFSQPEIEEYLRQTVGTVSATDLSALEQRTEGWIAGLQLAALPLADSENPSDFIRSFSGSQSYVMDYLVEEVLQRQPESIQRFLLQTSVLERLCPSLCKALLLEESNPSLANQSEELLKTVVHANLFLVPLDHEQRWHRYHQLFADVLRARLQQTEPASIGRLHERAAHWYLQQKLHDEAIHHALAAGNNELAAQIVELEADSRLRLGQQITLQGWLERLHRQTLASHPRLTLAQARLFIIVHKLDQAQESLKLAEAALITLPAEQQRVLRGQLSAITAGIALNRGQYQQAQQQAQQALTQLAPNDPWRAECLLHLGLASSALGNTTAAVNAYEQATIHSRQSGDLRTTLVAMFNQGATLHSGGQLRRAAHQYQQTIDYAQEHGGQQIPTTAYAYQTLGELWIEWNDLGKAAVYFNEAKLRNERGAQNRMLSLTHLGLARLHFASGNLAGAQQNLDQATRLIHEHQLPIRYAGPVQGFQVRLWLAQGDTQAAISWAERCELSPEDTPLLLIHEERYLALARVLAIQNQTASALQLLARYKAQMQKERRIYSVITSAALQALLLQLSGDKKQARAVLCETLTLTSGEVYQRTFLDEGAPMLALLLETLPTISDPTVRETINKLLANFPLPAQKNTAPQPAPYSNGTPYGNGTAPANGKMPATRPPIQPLIEPLSERELEILRVVAEGLSDRQVGERLIIAIGTVKKHLNNIYGKLGVGNRTGALARARELELL